MANVPESLFVVESDSTQPREKDSEDSEDEDEEEGMIKDPNTEVLSPDSPLIKVQ